MTEMMRAEEIPPFVVNGAYAGTVVYGPNGTFGPRVQQDLQLVLIHQGSMSVDIDGTVHAVPAGHAALLKPGRTELFQFDRQRQTWHRWISVMIRPLSSDALDAFDSLPAFIPLSEEMNQLTDLMLSLRSSGETPDTALSKTLGESAVLLYISEARRLNANDRKHPAVLLAKHEIHRRFAEDLDLESLAAAARKTPEHLIRLFRRDEGVTPIQYLWQWRTRQGLQLLRSTGLRIGEIAEQTGFKTSYHFARTIKRHTGLTPTEIRNQSAK